MNARITFARRCVSMYCHCIFKKRFFFQLSVFFSTRLNYSSRRTSVVKRVVYEILLHRFVYYNFVPPRIRMCWLWVGNTLISSILVIGIRTYLRKQTHLCSVRVVFVPIRVYTYIFFFIVQNKVSDKIFEIPPDGTRVFVYVRVQLQGGRIKRPFGKICVYLIIHRTYR